MHAGHFDGHYLRKRYRQDKVGQDKEGSHCQDYYVLHVPSIQHGEQEFRKSQLRTCLLRTLTERREALL